MNRARLALIVVAGASVLAIGSSAHAELETGIVQSAFGPLPLSHVTLYVAGDEKGSGAMELGSTFTDSNGAFAISYTSPARTRPVLYLIAEGPGDTTRLATVLGETPAVEDVTINERTTAATAFAMAQFIHGKQIGGNTPGVQNAASTFQNLVDLRTGAIGDVLGSRPNGSETNSMALLNSMANMVATCVDHRDCDTLMALATPPGGSAPDNTLDAMVNIAHEPWQNATELFVYSLSTFVYQPALSLPPVTWTMALLYEGNGHMFNGPGATAFDAEGNAWINNNYVFRKNINAKTCGGKEFFELLPNGANAPHSPFNGKRGGVDGAGFGICIDTDNNVWIGNFGFFGSTCPCRQAPPANSVSKFDMEGNALCPNTGFTQGCVNGPQATMCAPDGSIWIANMCGGSVTRYNQGDPADNWVFDLATLHRVFGDQCPTTQGNKPFGIAIDADSNAWVTDNGTDSTVKISPDGELLVYVGSDAGIDQPMGNATDSAGGVWISNSHLVHVPCETCGDSGTQDYGDLSAIDPSITHLDADGNPLGTFTGGGLWIPWGIAVDGDDNVWVANFGGQRVCAFNADGEPLAPLGYYSDALQRITAVTIDPSGNVWLANNWLPDPVQTNPGGNGMVVFLGLASPVKTPMFGVPQQP